jgi:hypothetical protein
MDWGVAYELHRVNERIRTARRLSAKSRTRYVERLNELHRDVAKLALIVRALGELAIRKGLVTEAELDRELYESDFADGVLDGELDPKLARPGSTRLAQLRELEQAPSRVKVAPVVRKKKRP